MDLDNERDYNKMWETRKRQLAYSDRHLGAEVHWFFIQGDQAIEQRLYVPGVVSLLHGIEMSLRMVVGEVEQTALEKTATLSNSLLRRAYGLGIPVEELAFSSEDDFEHKLKTNKPDVEIVRLRHDLSHGNTTEFIQSLPGTEVRFFTPECLRELADILIEMSGRWTESLSRFRLERLESKPG